ncbi:hypothetical protein Tco_0695896 [Tanacetum coccineum]
MWFLYNLTPSGESLSEAWTRFKDLLQKVPHHSIDLWLKVQIFYDHVNPATRLTIDQSAGGKLRDKNADESWALLEDLALYDNESWNDPRDFAKPVKAISLHQDVPSTSDCRLIELENHVQCLKEAHLAPNPPVQVNKIASSCKNCSGPYDTQYCMENPEQAFVDYASSCTNKVGEEQNRNPSSPKRVYFVNTITIIRKGDEPREAKIIEPDDNDHKSIVEVEKKAREGLGGPKQVIGENESWDIKWDDPNDITCGEWKEVNEVDEESGESKEEVKKEEEDEP